jgi:hypothetical protein
MASRPFAAKEGWSRPPAGTQVIEPGTPPSEEGIDMAVQAEIRDLLRQILAEFKEMTQQGIVTAVTLPIPAGSGVPIEVLFDPPLFSISLTCDAGANIEYRIPNRSNSFWVQLNVTEVVVFNFVKGMIPSVAVRAVAPGFGASAIRIVGTY